ncbi:radical SAM protein [Pectinatus haikarae]|uniref:Pyruvate formate lyase activating enzyme n=1 Tax=Pectinatus haikarae TaxID=349096 RepID=A0ABT9Y904_9FIRM|nr:radical SAM protein [Pectinatus haikarae]MDQ0203652.1 putative pyruvate formate lyase activating enzyme [Pectinatus haikarae]
MQLICIKWLIIDWSAIDIKNGECLLCPRRCKIDRSHDERGFCGAGAQAKVALVSIHKWEEPCISGKKGAGTVFFSHCNLRCEFCQNYAISARGYGVEVDAARLAEIFLEQQGRAVECLELVTPTHYAPIIIEALKRARASGLNLPVVYNTNAYESIEIIDALSEYVDVFLPDLKYFSDDAAGKYSHAPDYFHFATAAIKKMTAVAGPVIMENGLMKKGVLVRHLILPWLYKDSIKIVEWLWATFGSDIYISLMNQYTPAHNAFSISKLNRKLTTYEYQKVVDAALELGIENCFIQEKSASSTDFIPNFDGKGVLPVKL